MPLGGETVGHVWVKVHADGSGLDKEVESEFKDLDPVLKKAGKDNAASFNEGFMDEFKEGLEDVDKEMKKSPAQKGWDTRRFRQSLRDIEKDIEKFTDSNDDANDSLIRAKIILQDLAATEGRLSRQTDKLREQIKGGTFEETFKRSLVRAELLWGSIQSKGGKAFTSLKNGFSSLDNAEKSFGRLGTAMDDFATKAGKFSGKGNRRSGLLNAFGTLVESSVKLVGLLPKIGSGIAGLGTEGGSSATSQLPKLLTGAAGGAAALAVALVAISAIAAPLAAGLSGLAAVLISLTSVLVFAAAAAGGVAVVLGFTLVAAVGTAILALKNLPPEAKKSLDGVKSEFKDLGKVAGDAIGPGITRAMKILKPQIKTLRPLIKAVSGALGDVAVGFAKITEGAPFQKFIRSLTQFLPGAITSLGDIAGNFGEAFMGIFRALEPITTRFLDWLVDVSDRFAKWTNSAEGQSKMKDFFDKAADSAQKLGRFIGRAAEAIGKLLGAGNEEGNTIIDDLSDQLQRFIRYMQNPKNRKAISDFFKNGLEVARQFGHVVQALGRLFDALDGPNSRKAFSFILSAIGKVFDFWSAGAKVWSRVADTMINAVSRTANFVRVAANRIAAFFSNAWAKVKSSTSSMAEAVKGFGQDILDWFQDLPGKIADAFSGLGHDIVSAIGSIDLGSIIKLPGGKLGGLLSKAGLASGGLVFGAQHRLVGEAGPEAVVPLNRPLSLVDPSVRALSAFAQGLTGPTAGVSPNGSTDRTPVTINVTTVASDARAVALETMNYLTAQAY